MSRTFDIAVVGATGTVGEALLGILEERAFPVGKLYPLDSTDTVGTALTFRNQNVMVQDLTDFDFSQVQIALFATNTQVSREFVPLAVDAGCVVIDNSAAFRCAEDVPLIIPEVNAWAIGDFRQRMIIASPADTTTQLLVALKPIYDAVGLTRINVVTYQAVSASGKAALEELAKQTASLLSFKEVQSSVYPKQIAFNVLAQTETCDENGYTSEELQLVWETQKILSDQQLPVTPTIAKVPVFYGHSQAVHIETRDKIDADTATALLAQAPGVTVMDEHSALACPSAVTEAVGHDPVFIGRIREDISHPYGLNLWIVADNIRKGTALNSVQIAEILVKDYL